MIRLKILIGFLTAAMVICTGQVCHADLIGHWTLDEGTGTVAGDSSGNGADGTIYGDAVWGEGFFAGGLTFDGADDYILFGTGPSMEGTTDFTLAAWVKTTLSADGVIIQQRNGGYYGEYKLAVLGSGNVDFMLYGPPDGYQFSGFTSSSTVNDGVWHHVAVVRQGDNGYMYIDGAEDATQTGTVQGLDAIIEVGVGADIRDWHSYFDGSMDDIRVYNHALTPLEIMGLYATDTAILVAPSMGKTLVSRTPTLEWATPIEFEAVSYDVYLTRDPNFIDSSLVSEGQTGTTFDVTTELDWGTTYTWRVDAYESGVTEPHVGGLWTFTVRPDYPVVITQPVSQSVVAGSTAVFTVEAITTETYQWYKGSSPMTGETSDTLTITDVQLDDEAQYHCQLDNSFTSAPPVDSAEAGLWAKRLVAHWALNDNLTDSVGDWDGQMVDPNGMPADPNYVTEGIDGSAMKFFADGELVVITGSEDFFNFYPLGYTVSAWVKDANIGWGGIAGKQNEARTPDYGWVLNHASDTAYSTLRQTPAHDYGADASLTDGNWHFVVGMYDAAVGQVRCYADGKLVAASGEGIFGISGSAVPMVIGAESTDGVSPFGGIIDEVSIWSYPVDPYEIAKIYTDYIETTICVEDVPFDFNGNCVVDVADLAMFVDIWMQCNEVPTCLDQHPY